MGILEEVLAKVDALRRTAGRNVQDLVQQPSLYIEKVTDALRNTNRGVVPVASNGELTNRPLTPSERVEQTMGTLDFGGGLGVIKPRGGNWLSGQVEGALRGLRKNPENIRVAAGPNGPERTQQAKTNAEVLNQWIEGPLTKYVKRDMGSPNDPVRVLADQGILHVTPEQLPFQDRSAGLQRNRQAVGMPVEGIAQTPLGQAWENSADRFIAQAPADYYKYVPEYLRKDPWLANVPPETPIYDVMGSRGNELGFNHLVDELSNSLREGRLRPEQLQSGNFSVDAAVRHVAEINALRAKKAEEALRADMEGMPIHKDYPDQGYSWRQLKHEDPDILSTWLTQEGDAMGHCVGGYCDDVASGASNIYSLRDAKGRPHVTIETAPFNPRKMTNAQNEAATDAAWAEAERLGINEDNPDYHDWMYDAIDRHGARLFGATAKPSIIQIKGKANAAPKAEYLPFIQDFVRSGRWSGIGDAAHTGLSSKEIDQILKGTK